MAGTNEFAFFFDVEAYVPGGRGGPESGRKNSKNAFRPVPVPKSTFPNSGSEIAAPNRRSLATFIAPLNRNAALLRLVLEIASDFWGPRWASQLSLLFGQANPPNPWKRKQKPRQKARKIAKQRKQGNPKIGYF